MPRKPGPAAGPAAEPAGACTAPACIEVWGSSGVEAGGLTDEERLETEMLQLFARQDSWERRNILVQQKASSFSFDVGWETITQQQDLETQSLQGQTGGVVWDAAVRQLHPIFWF
eukprot:SAG31_NODE_1208_length_9381_cov_49.003232_6_plen_115_part_00